MLGQMFGLYSENISFGISLWAYWAWGVYGTFRDRKVGSSYYLSPYFSKGDFPRFFRRSRLVFASSWLLSSGQFLLVSLHCKWSFYNVVDRARHFCDLSRVGCLHFATFWTLLFLWIWFKIELAFEGRGTLLHSVSLANKVFFIYDPAKPCISYPCALC